MSGDLPWMDQLEDCKMVQKQKDGYLKDSASIKTFLLRCFQSDDYPGKFDLL